MFKLMLTNVPNYQAKLIAAFITFLRLEGTSIKTQKNYTTDVQHFNNWAVLTIQNTHGIIPQNHFIFLNFISSDIIEGYKAYLRSHHTPIATINRRLSALRMFFRCCVHEGFTDKNPTINIANISQSSISSDPIDQLLAKWKSHLHTNGTPSVTVKRYTDDVKEFLAWMQKKA